MRSSAHAALAAIAAAGCATIDVEQPIGIVADGLSPDEAYDLAEAATCWNLAFGVDLRVGAAAETVEQRVEVFYDERTCLTGIAETQAGWPTTIGICPQRHWDAFTYLRPTLFRVLSHELGHVLNIVGHPDDANAVMRYGGLDYGPMFLPVDEEWFAAANPDHAIRSACPRVIRGIEPGRADRAGRHCMCDSDRQLDLDRPLAIVADPVKPGDLATYQTALSCWNVRYGLALEIRDPQPGDQIAAVGSNSYYPYGRIWDNDVALAGVGGFGTTELRYFLGAVARLLDVHYDPYSGPLFDWQTDAAVARRYGRPVVCQSVDVDTATMTCRCLDVAPPPS